MKRIICCLAVLAVTGSMMSGAVYEVGTGKTYSTIGAAVSAAAGAGDVVKVYPGVYRESVTLKDGTAGNPFTLIATDRENTVIDGSEPLTGWTQCSSASQIGDNPDWQNIYVTDAPAGSDRLGINLFQDDSMMTLCQVPAASDPFYDEATGEWWTGSAYTSASVTDPVNLTQAENNYWQGAYVKIQAGNNVVYTSEISGYNAASHMLLFAAIGASSNFGTYCISNHPSLIRKPGDFYFDEDNRKIYCWPHDAATINTATVYSARDRGLYIPGSGHIVIDGFRVEHFNGQHCRMFECDDVVIKNCVFKKGIEGPSIYGYGMTNSVVESTYIGWSKDARGIIFGSGGSYNTVRYCTFEKTGGTAVDYYGESHSDLLYNNLSSCNGQHANGLTCYLGCSDILIKGNMIVDCNVGLTYQELDGLTVYNNVFDGGGTAWPVACWNPSNTSNVTFVHNTSINSGSNREGFYRLNHASITNLTLKNNILHGAAYQTGSATSHNIYTMIAPTDQKVPAETGSMILLNSEATLMVDHKNGDYHLKSGSAAIDAGTDVGIDVDMDGIARPVGSAPDIGAFEYDPTGMALDISDMPEVQGGVSVYPLPVAHNGTAVITFNRPVTDLVVIVNSRGQVVRHISVHRQGTEYIWNLRNEAGHPVGPGNYFVCEGKTVLGRISVR